MPPMNPPITGAAQSVSTERVRELFDQLLVVALRLGRGVDVA